VRNTCNIQTIVNMTEFTACCTRNVEVFLKRLAYANDTNTGSGKISVVCNSNLLQKHSNIRKFVLYDLDLRTEGYF